MKKILFHLGHPAHFHLFKNVVISMQKNGHKPLILIKKKDVLEDLLAASSLEYFNILPKGRKDKKFFIAWGLIKQTMGVFRFSIKHKPDLLVGTSASIGIVGYLLKIPSINVQEDDAEIIPRYVKLAYPKTNHILAPHVCSVGKYDYKKIGYDGYHELAYLHPNNFSPDKTIVEQYVDTSKPYFLIRFAKLTAHHDDGINGISTSLATKIIDKLSQVGNVYITSERDLEPEFETYRVGVNPKDMHHVLAFASIYIGDSQTMAAESGVLGVPFVRINDFIGKISYLDELENKYELGYGFFPVNESKILDKIDELLGNKKLHQDFQDKRLIMLKDKIDVAEFFTWFFEAYPSSADLLTKNPNYINKFLAK